MLLLLEFVFLLCCKLDHALKDSLLKSEILHRHIIHHLDMLLEKLVQVFDKSATWLLLTKRLPIMSVLENIIAVSS